MADNNKVTIDAAWFAELYARWIAKPTFSERMVANGAQAIRENEELRKERDKFKAKLAEHAELLQRTEAERVELKAKLEQERINKCDEVTAKRLAAAERCIGDIAKIVIPNEKYLESSYKPICDIIRAYREKEAK